MNCKSKSLFKTVLLFIIFFILIFAMLYFVLYLNFYGDPINNYGFSHAIRLGEVPYRDFNVISTPLYAFIMSVGLFLWDNSLMFLLEHVFLVSILLLLIYKMYGIKSLILFPFILITRGFIINPTYTFLALFFLVVVVFLEKKYTDRDYLIGFFLGLCILSKHTVGIFFVIPSLVYYHDNILKLKKRFIGLIIPIAVFTLYLIITNSYMEFLNLCIFGLFDFLHNNGAFFRIELFLGIVFLIISVMYVRKYYNDRWQLYYTLSFSFMIPLFDSSHFALFFVCVLLQVVSSIQGYDRMIASVSIVVFGLMFTVLTINGEKRVFNNIDKFQYIYTTKARRDYSVKLFNYYDSFDNKLIFGGIKMFYDISRNNKIDYYDIPLYGNHGFNGTETSIKKIKEMRNVYIFVSEYESQADLNDNQFDKGVSKYVEQHCKYVETKYKYKLYYKK